MQDLNDKITGGSLSAPEWNEVPSEIQNIIEDMGLTLSSGDLNQLGKAVAGYVAAGDFYSETGAADAYVATKIGAKQAPANLDAVMDGMRVRFIPGNANTGASTINVNALGVKNIVREDGSALSANDLESTRVAELRYDDTADNFRLLNPYLPSEGTPVPARGYIDGFQMRRDPVDVLHDVEIEKGICRDDADTRTLKLAAAITKRIDANWAAGDNAGGFPSALTLSANTWYHVFVIRKVSDGSVDAGFDTSPIAANLLTDAIGYTEFRRVGSVRTDSSSNVEDFFQRGDAFFWAAIPPLDLDSGAITDAEALFSVTVPPDFSMEAIINAFADHSGATRDVWIYDPNATSATPSRTAAPLVNLTVTAGGEPSAAQLQVYTDTSQQLAVRASGASTIVRVATIGWRDHRGKDA